jgi:3-dehydroquinate dehydratase-2
LADVRQVYVLNGPNLDILGDREPALYGQRSLADLERLCGEETSALGLRLKFAQSNAEHVLIDLIHEAARQACGLILNPAAFSYTSYAIVDALRAADIPKVEVHLSNIHARDEGWRAKSLVSPVVDAIVSGMGFKGYGAALRWIAKQRAA